MRRYESSRFRIVLLAFMLLMAGALVGSALGQVTSTAAPADQQVQTPRFWDYLDYLFYFIIAVLSISGLALIIQGFIKNRASVFMPRQTIDRIRQMIANREFKELIDFTEDDPSFISKALNPALKRAPSFSSMKEAMETSVGVQTAEQFRRIEYLNIIGNLGPLLGLLGTVLGMIKAFTAMQAAGGNANPAQLAGGISTALTHTFLGLFVAVPALAAFGVLRTMVDRLTIRGALEAEELLLLIKPAEGGRTGADSRTVVPTPAGFRAVPQPSGLMPTPPPPTARKPAAPQTGLELEL